MFSALVSWWDGVELWMAQLPFVLQFVLVMAVLLPLAWLAAFVIDRGVDGVSARLRRHRRSRLRSHDGKPRQPEVPTTDTAQHHEGTAQ
ncbi:hypothetical protein [Actinoalloteichus spitiensis]|uniref:hypothetical protein n=1 Tax=Actinoalloteichus spitiensis TaxID=252394 RepID=UPI000365E600|nr:hypothetical protein [Actinoalloteichus spitiensis]